jgi:hypothetical protein
MPTFQPGTDYEEEEFPLNWPNERRIAYLNSLLADPNVKSVELLRRAAKIVVRTWWVDHLGS